MIRINLLPGKKKSAPALQAGPVGQWAVLAMVVGWVAAAATGYWLLTVEEDMERDLRAQSAQKNAQVEEIRKTIDEEGLQARKDKVEQLRIAIEKLKAQQRTPVYVMFELQNILTTGQMPDIDEEEQRRLEAADPASKLLPNWDATSVWLLSLKDAGGSLAFEGSARDAADLAEFTRRLRASSRFGQISHPDFTKVCKTNLCYLTWKLGVQVERWD